MYNRVKSGSPTKVAAIALPEPELRHLRTCGEVVIVPTREANHFVFTVYRFVDYADPTDYLAGGLYRCGGRITTPPTNLDQTLAQLYRFYRNA